MIEVEISKNRIQAQGHANHGFNEVGHDLVCCAVSTLICALAIEIESRDDLENFEIQQDSGYSLISAEATEGSERAIEALFDMVERGLRDISEQYPKSLKITQF